MKNSLLILILSMLTLTTAAQTNYYVATNGSNSNNGSINSPYLTIQTALNVASVGDTIYVKSGTYAEKLWWANSGAANNPITLTNYNNESVTISGINASNASQGALIQISSKSYIKITNIIFADNIMNYADGINVTGSGTDIEISNCEFKNIGWTSDKKMMPSPNNSAHAIIFIGTQTNSYNNILINNNYIHDCITGYSESLTMAGNIEDFIIEKNTINFNTNIGIDAAGHFTWTGAPANVNFSRNGIIRNNSVSDFDGPAALDAAGGIYVDGGSFITVENNTVFNYSVGFSVGCEVPNKSNQGNIVRNNIAYNCGLSGLFLGSNTTSVVNDTKVYNNTFYKCGTGAFDNGQMALLNNAGSDIRNNILYPANGNYAVIQFNGTTSTNKSINYNLLRRDSGSYTNFFYGVTGSPQNTVYTDPLFVDATTYDFHLQASSPAINAGDPSYTPASDVFDIDGEARLNGASVDIGVDEYNASLGTDSFQTNQISFYPNPTKGIINIKNISEYNYKIYNLNGQVVNASKFGLNTLDISNQKAGVYIVKLTNKNTLKENFIKIVKQ